MSYTDKSFGGLVNGSSGASSQNDNSSGVSLNIIGIVQDIILDETKRAPDINLEFKEKVGEDEVNLHNTY